MAQSRSFWKKPQGLLAISLALMIVGSFLAGMFHTSFYSVKVKEISFDADHGQLHGLLYMPEGAGPDNPRPVIVTTHGYLNSKEMQDAPAIEMSRRGYIVLALDQYDHGDSRWTTDIPVDQMFSTFWIYSQFDAAKYIYDQPYTLKDENGNAYVAVSGHSMGGFSSLLAMYFDEMNALQAGHRMIHAGIAVGADFSYASAVAPQDQLQAAFGSRTVGVIGGNTMNFSSTNQTRRKLRRSWKCREPLRARISSRRCRANRFSACRRISRPRPASFIPCSRATFWWRRRRSGLRRRASASFSRRIRPTRGTTSRRRSRPT
ncbi:alpha/beta hydrolase family protein [Cohnella algarum]|uniref:alpha/beta hydrolase family protein n=1 Tax=Cohnella algarum TaxID=2044859 RepID=UPI001F07E798|nr:alpha/beta hydrolase [Cohnella algarum]